MALVMTAAEAEVRQALRDALPARQRRFQWHDDGPRFRMRGVQALAELPVAGLVVHRGQVRGRQERARQHAMWDLAFLLADVPCQDFIFEARAPALNSRDDATMSSIGRVRTGLRHRFMRGRDEPLLWAADYLAGCVGELLEHGDRRYVDLFPSSMLEIVPIEPRR